MDKHQKSDPYLRYARDYRPRPGLGLIDEVNYQERLGERRFKRIFRNYEGEEHRRYAHVARRDPEEILCPGAAAVMDKVGIIRHAGAGDILGFSGFVVENHDPDRVTVFGRGAAFLRIDGLVEGAEGLPVFAEGPDSFNLAGTGVEIGRIRFIENLGRQIASVGFKAYDDLVSLDLRVDRRMRSR